MKTRKLPREGRLLLLLAALGGAGTRPTNRKILASVPGYPHAYGDGMRTLRRDLRDLEQAGILAGEKKGLNPADFLALQLLGPVAERSRRYPFRESILRAWRRCRAFGESRWGTGTQNRGQATLPLNLGLSPMAKPVPFGAGGVAPTVVSLGSDWPGKVEFIHRAVLDHRMVAFQYLRPSRRRGFRAHKVKPYGLGLRDGFWYLAGHDEGRDAVALFRLSRMRREGTLPLSFTPPASFDLRSALQTPAWSYGKNKKWVRISAKGSAVQALTEIPEGFGKFKRRNRNACEGSVLCGDVLDLARWILPFGSEIRILSPRRALQILKAEALRVARA